MIATDKPAEVKQAAEHLCRQGTDWITFYREIFGLQGVIRHMFPSQAALGVFEQTDAYHEVLEMLATLRAKGPAATAADEPTRVITVRMPKSMHDALREEAYEHRTSMNQLCISKLLQFIDAEKVPSEV